MNEKKAPVAKFSVGTVTVSVWENDAKEGRQFKSVSIQKNYKIGEQWKSTNSMNINEIPKAILALQKAYEHIALKDEMILTTQTT
ncbi:MAG: hypothetical protein CL944_00615 [Candidatus Diapherotrites archaeon]|uniref:Uncharacterized protein n=1 Tax=Candidatus Iainarchaeum sp. TaxID=3101447 RepID=A0A2D6LP49_9ARCH|nr:hypothetical protein [Candidatus Diapherotrites archaeon]|tara:strand:+ start:1575 stop:1829 length:255 start_codon:yes stop_codon:yes gene_type:complete